ncbi:arginase family protein [Rufibacter roseolus]|uniref:hypothetical protein n=1 Tax=Rufibacter roseolus TaxID=2817375 RepID=UPI001B304F52|nr:hypothetical protein [Rufibacter roseolus]
MTPRQEPLPTALFNALGNGNKVFVSSNRLISRGDISYKTNTDLAMQVMMEMVKGTRPEPRGFIPLVAGDMLNSISFDRRDDCLYIESHPAYDVLIPILAQVFDEDHPLIGSEVTYQWPNGKTTSITTTQSALYSGAYWIMYVRHEERTTPVPTHYIIQFSSKKEIIAKNYKVDQMKHGKIITFYMEEQVDVTNEEGLYTKSAAKPLLLLNKLEEEGLHRYLDIHAFEPFSIKVFYLAHTKEYVDSFFGGKEPLAMTNGLTWSERLANSVRYTNASLYNAILHAVKDPSALTFSPTSGFHHAKPERGAGFCTFSGQVIASLKIYKELGLSGAYLDLDQHYGNSIEDSRQFVDGLDKAIPKYANVNVKGTNEDYLSCLRYNLAKLKDAIHKNEIHYVVWCHGADSHVFDDLGGSVNTEYWLLAAQTFYRWVLEVEREIGKNLPVIMSLFGGYRPDDYNSVLELHTADLMLANRILLGHQVDFTPKVSVNKNKTFDLPLEAIVNGETLLGHYVY